MSKLTASTTCVFMTLLLSAAATTGHLSFSKFQLKYAKSYTTDNELIHRRQIYNDNMNTLNEQRILNPKAMFSLDVPHADLTITEFRTRNTGYLPSTGPVQLNVTTEPIFSTDALAIKKIDWRNVGAVDPFIFTQGECGCCWAISVTQTVGSQYFLHSSKNITSIPSLSFQQLICCDCGNVDAGCHGGDPHVAYEYILNAGGLETNKEYPFTDSGPDAQSCNLNGKCNRCTFDESDVAASITGYINVTQSDHTSGNPGNETKLAQVLAEKGPISVCIDSDPWRFYQSGILTYGARNLNHCVQLIGMDSTFTTPYWILKNSWGKNWGEEGYIRMQMGTDVCGVADVATMPLVE